jgi:two-component system, sensor histidine kinase and response regulator
VSDPGRVFIVDDEAAVRETLQTVLSADGHQFTSATNGADALARLQEEVPDVILLDVMMPAMDGHEVCRRIKADPRLRHVPVVLVTVLESKEDLVKGLDAGADEFLSKPVAAVELRARVRSMLRIKRQHDRLAAALKARDELAHMIVHDIRAPLGVIVIHAEWLAQPRNAPNEDGRRRAKTVMSQAERMSGFLNDMLMLAKLEAGKLTLKRAVVDIREMVRVAAAQHLPIAESRNVLLVVDVPPEARWARLDPDLVGRVLDNLLSNALKYSAGGETVSVVVSYGPKTAESAGIHVEVRDQGPGVADADKARIFEKFEIVDQARRGLTQVGLGLNFSRLAVEAHGGRISIRDNTPRGSIFAIDL